MSMKASDTGIEWGRIRPEDYDAAASRIQALAEGCVLDHSVPMPGGAVPPYGRRHYKTRDGRTVCPYTATEQLKIASRKWSGSVLAPITTALANALPKAPKVDAYRIEEPLAA
jgi:hypothetical protein